MHRRGARCFVAVALCVAACATRRPAESSKTSSAPSTAPLEVVSAPSPAPTGSAAMLAFDEKVRATSICDDGALVPPPKLPEGTLLQADANATGKPRLRTVLHSIGNRGLAPGDVIGILCRDFSAWKKCFTAVDAPSSPVRGSWFVLVEVLVDGGVGRVISTPERPPVIDSIDTCIQNEAATRSFPSPAGHSEAIMVRFVYDHGGS